MQLYACEKSYLENYLKTIENATAEERMLAINHVVDEISIVSMSANKNEAVIKIRGLLSPNGPSPIDRFFGFDGTGYNEIISASEILIANDSITDVVIKISSPGGFISGMGVARKSLEELAKVKNVTFENHGLIASAAYYLATASGAKEIVATSALDKTGSIGVMIAGMDFSENLAKNGVKEIKIISVNAPNKNPDPTTDDGAKLIQEDLNAVERVVISDIAKGRNTTPENVIENFGKGGVFVASDPDATKPSALKAGMIDRIIDKADNNGNDHQNEEVVMDKDKLKAEHSSVYDAVIALGVAQERERVETHLELGAVGDMKYAISCIKDGKELSGAVNAKHAIVAMNKKNIADRSGESEGSINTPESKTDEELADESLAAATAEVLGVEQNA